jgi:hypothetical protein
MENSSSCVEERAGLEGRFFHSPSVFQLSVSFRPLSATNSSAFRLVSALRRLFPQSRQS